MEDYRLDISRRRWMKSAGALAGFAAMGGWAPAQAQSGGRIVLGTWHPRALGTALITSSLAVAVASPVTHLEHALTWPDAKLSYLFGFLALAIAPLAAADAPDAASDDAVDGAAAEG